MAALREESARLPSGKYFETWEAEQVYDRVLHVAANASNASDENDGSESAPFKTIDAAAAIATPGTRVLIHAGTYRESVKPAMGGESPERMISYEAAGDGEAIIKGSVVATKFAPSTEWQVNMPDGVRPPVWKVKLNPADFPGYNPFGAMNIIHDRIYVVYGSTPMKTYLDRRGVIFVDGKPLKQVAHNSYLGDEPGTYWVESNGLTVHFRTPDDSDPANHLVELTRDEMNFAPEEEGLNYIKVSGLTFTHAGNGAPIPQRGAISARRGKYWIIEDCTIEWANTLGIDVGAEDWNREFQPDETFGFAIIRRNKILNCGVCGIAGFRAINLLIEDNLIQGTGWQLMEMAYESAGIKIHNCRDSLMRRNIITKTIHAEALWMDVGNYNNRYTQNLFLDGLTGSRAIYIEASRHGINLFDNNIIWNVEGRFDEDAIKSKTASGGWYELTDKNIVNGHGFYGDGSDDMHIVNNLVGKCRGAGYFQHPVPFRQMGRGGTARDAKIYNNIFYACGEAAIKFPTVDNESEGNAFIRQPSGYLRINYPTPSQALDLTAWRKYHDFDQTGIEGDFTIDVDTDNFTLTVRRGVSPTRIFMPQIDPSDLPKVKADERITIDFFGNEVTGARIAGPFTELYDGVTYNIDPRKL